MAVNSKGWNGLIYIPVTFLITFWRLSQVMPRGLPPPPPKKKKKKKKAGSFDPISQAGEVCANTEV